MGGDEWYIFSNESNERAKDDRIVRLWNSLMALNRICSDWEAFFLCALL